MAKDDTVAVKKQYQDFGAKWADSMSFYAAKRAIDNAVSKTVKEPDAELARQFRIAEEMLDKHAGILRALAKR